MSRYIWLPAAGWGRKRSGMNFVSLRSPCCPQGGSEGSPPIHLANRAGESGIRNISLRSPSDHTVGVEACRVLTSQPRAENSQL